jgi:hypothetical protein
MKMPIYPGRERSVTNCSQKSGLSLVHRLLNPLGFVAFKMGRLQGATKEHI